MHHTTISPGMRRLLGGAVAAAVLLGGGIASAQQAAPTPAAQATQQHVPLQKTIGVPHADRPVPSLAVLNAGGAKLEGTRLTLTGVSGNVIVFADRPVRAAGHETVKQFLAQWDEGKNSFAVDPPNATVSVLGANPGEVSDAVVILKAPKLDGTTLTFDVQVLEGQLTAGGPVALFIDAWAVRGPYGGGAAHWGGYGYGGYRGATYYHPPVYHGAWYAHPAPVPVPVPVAPAYPAGAAAAGFAAGALTAGAAAAAASYPRCGYYPYPPCY